MECLNKVGVVQSPENNYSQRTSIKFLESTYKMIVDDLIGEAILEVCFEVHRAAKLGYLFLEYPEPKESPNTISETSRCVICPVCNESKGAFMFTKHLATCMKLSKSTTRVSKRAVSQKIADSGALSNYFDESDYDSDSGSKKKTKKNKGKANARRKPKVQGSSNAKLTDVNYNEMAPDKIQEFLNRKCGVITKRTNKMCAKTMKCSQHTNEERRNVRLVLLKDTNEQIDVDTLEENEVYSFMMDTESGFPSQ